LSHPDEAIALLRAVLRENCTTDLAARRHLNIAGQMGVDPLDYCAHRFGLGSAETWRRVAVWLEAPFASVTPSRLPVPPIARLDHLGGARTLRQQVLGEEVLFVAPWFAEAMHLHAAPERLKRHLRIVPPEAIEAGLTRAASGQLMDEARQRLTRLWPRASASQDLPRHARIGFALLLAAVILVVMVSGVVARPVLIPLVTPLLMIPGVLRLVAAVPHASGRPAPRLLSDAELPIYSVLIPLRDEAAMVPLLRRAMGALDYPPEKLDIRFVVEERSRKTVAAVEAVLADPMFRMVVVPDGPPRTKPKALDYALPLARGKYLVVFDAEDMPEPQQLRLAASLFEADPGLACLQAELMPENASETALTALFAGEYAGLFGRLLPALSRWGLPMPLGGTSNHFRLSVLRDIGGWDAFNVTEDADLGVRLARRGLRTECFDSRTYEGAPLTLRAWMAQRTRWMKGWMRLCQHKLTSRFPSLSADPHGASSAHRNSIATKSTTALRR